MIFTEIYMNFPNFRKILQGSHNFREIHKKCSKCKNPYEIQWNIDEIWLIFMIFARFALLRKFRTFRNFSQNSAYFTLSTFFVNFTRNRTFRIFSLQCATCEICFVFPMKMESILIILPIWVTLTKIHENKQC